MLSGVVASGGSQVTTAEGGLDRIAAALITVDRHGRLNPAVHPGAHNSHRKAVQVRVLGAADKAASLGGESPLPSIAWFGRLAYPMLSCASD